MSKTQIIRIGMAVCVLLLAAAVLISVTGIFNGSVFGYANPEKYTAGEAAIQDPVKNLEIDWTNGKVRLEYYDGDAVELRETSDKPIGADLQLRWWLDGDTLRVQYAKSGFRLNWNQEKELTVRLPEGTSFGNASIKATSGALELPALRADTLTLAVTSGEIGAAAEAKQISVSATSGDVKLNITGPTDSLTAEVTSGSLEVEAEEIEALKAGSTSGSVRIRADRVKKLDAGTTSGGISVKIREGDQAEIRSTSGNVEIALEAFSALKAGSTSGTVTAALPETPGFTASLGTTSGSLEYTLPLSRSGDQYVCGDGSAQVEIHTTSGNIRVGPTEQK